ncbi:MAG: hypothetical protein FWF60_01325 [Oscillospiraceae bacterium]|nr:hypothetical protein [Oscillospiraceae bacterium]
MVLGLLALAPITAHAATIEVANATQFADALAQPGDNTIRLTANIDYNDSIYIDTAKTITLDLNGKTLNATGLLYVLNGGKLLLADPANGQFNVFFVGNPEVFVWVGGADSKVDVTNVTFIGSAIAVVEVSGELTVYGNVTSSDKGVTVHVGGKITVNGTLTVAGDYIDFDGTTSKTATDFVTPSTKTGYKTYTDGTSTVWVKCAAHTPGDWTVDTAATATTAGSKHKECTACKAVTETQVIPATGKFIHLWGKETKWLDNFWNWLLVIFCFGWIWMAF